MEKFPNQREFRLVGSASEENKSSFNEVLNNKFYSHLDSLSSEEKGILMRNEIQKSPDQINVISVIQEVIRDFTKEIGVECRTLPVDNYHLIKGDSYKSKFGNESRACFSLDHLAALFNEEVVRESLLLFTTIALHESIHSAMHMAFNIIEVEGQEHKYLVGPFRSGVKAHSNPPESPHAHFDGLDEAIVSDLEISLLVMVLEHPSMKNLKSEFYNPNHDVEKQRISREKKINIDEVIIGDNFSVNSGYAKNREVLQYICSEVAKNNPEDFPVAKDVMREFHRAHFTGRLMNIAHIVEGTFGKGSFRILGNMTDDKESGQLHLDQLKKLRLNFSKQK